MQSKIKRLQIAYELEEKIINVIIFDYNWATLTKKQAGTDCAFFYQANVILVLVSVEVLIIVLFSGPFL